MTDTLSLTRSRHIAPRSHVETVVVDGQEYPVKLGVFLSNTRSRRGTLTADKLQQLAALGLQWAA